MSILPQLSPLFPLPLRTCPNCNVQFEPNNHKHTFCSLRCYNKSWRRLNNNRKNVKLHLGISRFAASEALDEPLRGEEQVIAATAPAVAMTDSDWETLILGAAAPQKDEPK